MANQPLNIDLLIETQIMEIKRQSNSSQKHHLTKKTKKQEPCY